MRSSLHRNHPVRRRSVCTTTPVTSSGVSRCGCPSICTYWKPCVVCRGSNVSPSRPAEITVSVCATHTWSLATLRSVTSPSASRTSPCTSVSSVPDGPEVASRTQPLTFWPRSTTCRVGSQPPHRRQHVLDRASGGAGEYESRGARSCSTTVTGPQSAGSTRWSSRCPSMRSAAQMGPSADRQPASLVTTTSPASSWPRNATRSP